MSQNSNLKPRIEISEDDLFTYYLQKIWHTKDISFDEFEEIMISQGVKIIDALQGDKYDTRKNRSK